MSGRLDLNDHLQNGDFPEDLLQGTPALSAESDKNLGVCVPSRDEEIPGASDGGPWIGTSGIFRPIPPPKFVIPELQINPGRSACLAAYAGAGKTIAMQSAALAVAAGRPVWGWFRQRGPARVRHADQDQGAGTMRRYQRLARGMGLTPEDLGDRLEVSTFPSLCLTNTDDDVWFRACDGVDLMLLDALRGFVPGVDENDSEIQRHLMRLAKISERTGCSFWLAHHFGKPQGDAKPELARLRGSSGIAAGLGSVFALVGAIGAPKEVTHVKSHPDASGGLIEPFALQIEDVASDDGTDMHWGLRCVFRSKEQVDPPQSPDERRVRARQIALAAVTRAPGLSANQLFECAKEDAKREGGKGFSKGTFLQALAGLAGEKRVENRGSEDAGKWFPVPDSTEGEH